MLRDVVALALLAACSTQNSPPAAPPPPAEAPAEANAPATQDVAWTTYGEAVATDNVMTAEAFLADPSPYVGKNVVVEGRVSEVCQKAGCWMVMSHGEKHMRVRMKDHAFSVAKDGNGAACQVQGEVVEKALDPAEVAHFASETRAGGVVPEHAAAAGRTFEMVASGVRMTSGT